MFSSDYCLTKSIFNCYIGSTQGQLISHFLLSWSNQLRTWIWRARLTYINYDDPICRISQFNVNQPCSVGLPGCFVQGQSWVLFNRRSLFFLSFHCVLLGSFLSPQSINFSSSSFAKITLLFEKFGSVASPQSGDPEKDKKEKHSGKETILERADFAFQLLMFVMYSLYTVDDWLQ